MIREDGERVIAKLRGSEPSSVETVISSEVYLVPGEPQEMQEPPGPEGTGTLSKHLPKQDPLKKKEEEDARVASLDRGHSAKWQEYYDSRMYKEFLAEAERRGLENLYETLAESQLWQLANSARYVKRSEVAIGALQSIRSRFQDSSKAPVATFLLGRISSENQNDHRTACSWFQVYLQEYPGGKLAEESLGRSIDSCWKAGMKSRARRAAKTYLKSYPKGSFKELAASILSK
jgi:TolA-binding protein